MKKYGKIIGVIALCLLTIWVILVIIDCIRLGSLLNGFKGKQPIITIGSKEYSDSNGSGTEYIGLGYSVNYYNSNHAMGYKAEVKLFYTIPVTKYEVQ